MAPADGSPLSPVEGMGKHRPHHHLVTAISPTAFPGMITSAPQMVWGCLLFKLWEEGNFSVVRVTLKWWYHRFGGRALRYQGRLKVPTKCLHSCGKSDKAKCFHRNNIISQTELNIRPKSLKQNDSKTYCLVTLEEIRLGSLERGKLHCL